MAATRKIERPSVARGAHAIVRNSQALVSWKAPLKDGGAPITDYSATARPGGMKCTTTKITCTVRGLKSGTSYTFKVVARNRAGAGPASAPSNAVVVRTPGDPSPVTSPVSVPTTPVTTTPTAPTTTTTVPVVTTTTTTTTTTTPAAPTTTTTAPVVTTTTTTTTPTTIPSSGSGGGGTEPSATSYTVTFNSAGGNGTMENEISSTPEALSPNTFIRSGYLFIGWGTQPSGGVFYAPGATYNFASSLNLFAQWSAVAAPVITQQPTSQTVGMGNTATFSAAASGPSGTTVQWYQSSNGGTTWSSISGAVQTSYSVTTTLFVNDYQYEAIFSDAGGSTTSSSATLINLAGSGNWSGYIDTGGTFSAVSASWVVPTVTCSGSGSPVAVQWAGIDGYGSSTVEQDGTATSCSGSTPEYSAWYEMYGDPNVNGGYMVALPSSSYPVAPGNAMSASVTLSGSEWTLRVVDTTAGWTFSTVIASPSPAPSATSAEWIVESPQSCSGSCTEDSLADFGTVTFTNASVTSSTAGTGSITSDSVIALETTGNSGDVMMAPGVLNGSGTSFSDTWSASS